MKLFRDIIDKVYLKQWNIGLSRVDVKELIKTGNLNGEFHWLPLKDPTRLLADPFIFKNKDGNINVIYEDFFNIEWYGKISITTVDANFKPIFTKQLLDTKSHLSYPNVFVENGKTYIIPEASKNEKCDLISYEYDFINQCLINKKVIIEDLPLLDSTILHHNNKYWLFATKRGNDSNNKLYIYHAANWDGPYTAHQGNPVKNTLAGSRPAGNFIKVNGEIYRPAQNCADYYGKSICMNKIIVLNEQEFLEETVVDIKPPKNTIFNYAIHTINFADDVIVIDGLSRSFLPLTQIKIFIQKKLRFLKKINPAVILLFKYDYFISPFIM